MFKTLSGRFLILTIIFVMLAEVLIFIPSIARYRQDYLLARLERSQIASFALLANNVITPELQSELLANAGVYNVVLRRSETRELVLSSPVPDAIGATYDLRDPSAAELIIDALRTLAGQDPSVVRVIGNPIRQGGNQIEVTLPTADMRAAMLSYGVRIFYLSLFISVVSAALLFLAVRRLLVAPMGRVVGHMRDYAQAPQDVRRIIEPSASALELREAEQALNTLQLELTAALKQKQRLAQLGESVAKVSHDLRNILTTVQLFSDRMEDSDDPTVQRLAPKLVRSVSRAVHLTESTLAFGKANEPAPTLGWIDVNKLAQDILETESFVAKDDGIDFLNLIPQGTTLRADKDQLHRALDNLVRNARQALETRGTGGRITMSFGEDKDQWWIDVSDTGKGIPEAIQKTLFKPFQSMSKSGGTGLGLAISLELIQGHGGTLTLTRSGPEGTTFRANLPKSLL